MKDIFTDLYNKVLGFFSQTEEKPEEESAKDVACNRLKFVLMQDRTNLSPELMDRMRKELIELLSKYVEMDKEALELGFEQEGSQMALMLSIPVLRAKEESEIEAILAKEDEEKGSTDAEEAVDETAVSNSVEEVESSADTDESVDESEIIDAGTTSVDEVSEDIIEDSEKSEITDSVKDSKKSTSKKEEKETVVSK